MLDAKEQQARRTGRAGELGSARLELWTDRLGARCWTVGLLELVEWEWKLPGQGPQVGAGLGVFA
jgi:hypothetical protein